MPRWWFQRRAVEAWNHCAPMSFLTPAPQLLPSLDSGGPQSAARKWVPLRAPRVRVACVRVAFVRVASVRVAFVRDASLCIASVRIASVRVAFVRVASVVSRPSVLLPSVPRLSVSHPTVPRVPYDKMVPRSPMPSPRPLQRLLSRCRSGEEVTTCSPRAQ